jgi:hypothetical protein
MRRPRSQAARELQASTAARRSRWVPTGLSECAGLPAGSAPACRQPDRHVDYRGYNVQSLAGSGNRVLAIQWLPALANPAGVLRPSERTMGAVRATSVVLWGTRDMPSYCPFEFERAWELSSWATCGAPPVGRSRIQAMGNCFPLLASGWTIVEVHAVDLLIRCIRWVGR